ncbi:ATP-binding cassette domain-containing protein [Roseovarius salis]|uniref:ABC transporter ATP-binding protein n=1 Tax=Roseovarius salis TaxID=3376063 RepID=UPI0037C6B186
MQTEAPIIDARNIDKLYNSFQALYDIALQVRDGEFVALVGPSGCGKTSLLKILAGFEHPTRGSLQIQGRDVVGVPPSARPTRMVFQKLALFPHRTVRQNIAFPLKLARTDAATTRRRVSEMMDLMHLPEAYLDRFPAQLSGGEQQRVALARSMISNPSVLLLDEPLSALDVKLRKALQTEIKHLHRTVGTSFVHVTHDLEEAMMLADRICVMRGGRILQTGSPTDIYYRPADDFVAGFIGETNLFDVELSGPPDRRTFRHEAIKCDQPVLGPGQVCETVSDDGAALMVRPEMIRLHPGDTPPAAGTCVIAGRVEEFFIKGASIQYRVIAQGQDEPVIAEILGTARPPADVGDTVSLVFDTADGFVLKRS